MAESRNEVVICGRLGKDPDIREVGANKTTMAKMSVATKERKKVGDKFEQETEWHTVVLWGKPAESCRSLRKGSLVHVEGKLKTRVWEKAEGDKRYFTEIVASKLFVVVQYADQDAGLSDGDDPRPTGDNRNRGQERSGGTSTGSRRESTPSPSGNGGSSQGQSSGNDDRFPF
jgi:single-strand DNA-binding protein